MNASDYEITDGYIGGLGKIYETATDQTLNAAIDAAIAYNDGKNFTRETIIRGMDNGYSVAWCKAPNYYYSHSEGMIRRKRAPKIVETKLCDCGHEVPVGQVMSASLGTSCSDCYDNMSG